jgi:hypothetical protein
MRTPLRIEPSGGHESSEDRKNPIPVLERFRTWMAEGVTGSVRETEIVFDNNELTLDARSINCFFLSEEEGARPFFGFSRFLIH